eukprot:13179869-Alexandrium_andersonii.AAC.1
MRAHTCALVACQAARMPQATARAHVRAASVSTMSARTLVRGRAAPLHTDAHHRPARGAQWQGPPRRRGAPRP